MDISNVKTKIFEYDKNILLFWQSIKDYQIPTTEEELQWYNQMKNGDEDAKTKLIMGHQRIIFAMAKQYAKNASEIIDYVNEGTIGLLKAIDSYDPTRGFRFITYASHYIRREMSTYFCNTNNIVYSSNINKYCNKVKKINKEYFDKNGYYPSLDEIKTIIKEKYNITVKNDSDLYNVIISDIVFDEDNDTTAVSRENEYNKFSCSYNNYEKKCDDDFNVFAIGESLKHLNNKERDIIEMLFGVGSYNEPHSIDDVADKYGTTTSYIGQTKRNAIKKLKNVITLNIAV